MPEHSRAEQARLVARLTPVLATVVAEGDEITMETMTSLEIGAHLSEDSPAGRLVRDPASALGQQVRLVPDDRLPSEEALARWREERLVERYGI